jgi:mannose-6-phosphate isomerase class I
MALHHLAPGEKFPLLSTTATGGRKTRALVKTDRFEVVQLVLNARDEISGHPVPGYTILQCIEGAVSLRTPEDVRLNIGEWLYLARAQKYSLSAIEDSSLLLTILFE